MNKKERMKFDTLNGQNYDLVTFPNFTFITHLNYIFKPILTFKKVMTFWQMEVGCDLLIFLKYDFIDC